MMQREIAGLIFLWTIWQGLSPNGHAATGVHNATATPLAITFFANDPDSPSVGGDASASISFRTTGGSNTNTWQVQIQATSASFANCPSTVPVSRVNVTCGSVTASNGGSGTCAPSSALSTTLQTVASGNEGNGNASPYNVTLNFTFTDSWGYIAVPTGAPCAISLNYLITAN